MNIIMKELVELLIKKGKTISTMESCTGGGVANAITNIEGSSEILKFSAVTYSNEFKIKMGVDKKVIEKYTVYSMQTAIQMSKNISDFTQSDYGIGITGKLNYPDVNNPTNDNNTVYISVYVRKTNEFINFTYIAQDISRKENKDNIINLINEKLIDVIK